MAKSSSKPTVTTGKAADKTVSNMVRDMKAGKGTLSYTPGKPPPRKGSK